jgi:predicted amidophosphoribosyltransferase
MDDHHDVKRCPHCGESLPAVRDAFCVYCREPLEDDEPPGVDRLSLECPDCGEWYPSDHPRCPVCGSGGPP